MRRQTLELFLCLLMAFLLAGCPCGTCPDEDGDEVCGEEDCNDANAEVFPGAVEVCNAIDDNCNGVADEAFDSDGDGYLDAASCLGVAGADDCDDEDASAFPGAVEQCDEVDHDCDGNPFNGVASNDFCLDSDGDGYGDPLQTETVCQEDPPEGYVLCSLGSDCDDADGAVNSEATETCDGVDQDCDGEIDEDFDADADGFFDQLESSCVTFYGAVIDCDDSDAAVNSAATEVCDGVDNDCDCSTDSNADGVVCGPGDDGVDEGFDFDEDGVLSAELCPDVEGADDCDDDDALVNPSAPEQCNDQDDDCDCVEDTNLDGVVCGPGDDGVDEQEDIQFQDWYLDNDEDGHGDPDDLEPINACAQPGTRSNNNTDCDDDDATVNPSAAELCDGEDQNCDGEIDEVFDADADGFFNQLEPTCVTFYGAVIDCDDDNDLTNSGATEICDGSDNDCLDGVPEDETDDDGDGYVECAPWVGPAGAIIAGGDCDDSDEDLDSDGVLDGTLASPANEASSEVGVCDGIDQDCNGVVDDDSDGDGDGVTTCGPDGDEGAADDNDCDDTDDTIFPGAPELCDSEDNDCDGDTGDEEVDADADDFTPCTGDCDDNDDTSYPGASEVCDGADNDCDPLTVPDGGEDDADGDLYFACSPVSAGVNGDDCDDNDATVNPGATEVCDGADQNCNNTTDEGFDVDQDGVTTCGPDGDIAATADNDCDDNDGNRYPGNNEACDGIDNDCDSGTEASGGEADADSDTYLGCTPTSLGINGDDCDDTDDTINPGATEVCDAVDQDCDTVVDDGFDADGDLVTECGPDGDPLATDDNDCDETDATIFPGAPELCDGEDNNCDGSTGDEEVDGDTDGLTPCEGDCDDTDALTFPGATESCDGVANDCGSSVPSDESDLDGDDYVACGPWIGSDPGILGGDDCDDGNAVENPGATELCNGVDDNCDDVVPDDESDGDSDGYVGCSSWTGSTPGVLGGDDCDNDDAEVSPGISVEVCDGKDNDCDGDVLGDENSIDADGDGASPCNGDCDDADASLNQLDLDVDGHPTCPRSATHPSGYTGTGTLAIGADCDDADARTWGVGSDPAYDPVEYCDGVDNDCDQVADDSDGDVVADGDGDGADGTLCGGDDCDDSDPYVFTELESTPTSGFQRQCSPAIQPPFALATNWADTYYNPAVHSFDGWGWGYGQVAKPVVMEDPESGDWYMYVRGLDPIFNDDSIGVTQSSDGGLTWDGLPSTPAFEVPGLAEGSSPTGWETDGATDPDSGLDEPTVAYVDTLGGVAPARPYVLLYQANSEGLGNTDCSARRSIGMATATAPEGPFEAEDLDGSPLTAPIFTATGNDGDAFGRRAIKPFLRYDSATETMQIWFTGEPCSGTGDRTLQYSESTDGTTWSVPVVALQSETALEGSDSKAIDFVIMDSVDPLAPDPLEFWYMSSKLWWAGTGVDGQTLTKSPILTASGLYGRAANTNSAVTPYRMDGNNIDAPAMVFEGSGGVGTYHAFYGALADNREEGLSDEPFGDVDGDGDADASNKLGYVAHATNEAPVATLDSVSDGGSISTTEVLTGTITDTAPDTVLVEVFLDGASQGTAAVDPPTFTDPLDPRSHDVQQSNWSLTISGSTGTGQSLQVVATDEGAAVRRTAPITVDVN